MFGKFLLADKINTTYQTMDCKLMTHNLDEVKLIYRIMRRCEKSS